MNRYLHIAGTCALAAVTVTTLALGYGIIVITTKVSATLDLYNSIPKKLNLIADRISNPTSGTLAVIGSSIQQTSDHANAILDDLDRQPGHGKPQGTIQNVNKLLHDTGSVVTHVDLVARHYEQQMTEQDARVSVIAKDIHSSLQDLDASIRATKPLLDAGTQVVNSLNVSVNKLTPLAQTVISSAADTMVQGTAIAIDFRKMADHVERKVDAPSHWYSPFTVYGPAALKLAANLPW